MSLQITFERKTSFTGRNGYFKCVGIDLLKLDHNKSLIIAPLTSKGSVARCDIEIPNEDLRRVGEMLIRLAAEK